MLLHNNLPYYEIIEMDLAAADKKFKEKLVRNVKKEVKQIMEEAVTRKFVHEESSSITSLSAAVEACLSQGLRRRALGLFKTSSTTALLHKVAKSFEPAAVISKKVIEVENADPNRRSSSSGDSTNRLPHSTGTLSTSASINKPLLQKKISSSGNLTGSQTPKYLWIRLALFEKCLAIIIDHLVQNASKYYEKDSLVADPDYGSILSPLLVGPCALEYSKNKTQDHFWTDPPADELVQRHRISSGVATPSSCRGSVLNKDLSEPMPGYLSLHQTTHSLTIKWTPNQLMNGYSEADSEDKSMYWDYAMNVRVDEIVYVHCHQQGDSGGTIVLVGQDGVQRPPFHFPPGGHLLAFLSCLENGLLPHGQLDPPLWSQRGKGKVFPKLRRKGRILLQGKDEITFPECFHDEESSDYVFQIISKTRHEDFLSGQELMDPHLWLDRHMRSSNSHPRPQLFSSSTSSTSSSKSISNGEPDGIIPSSPLPLPHRITTGDSPLQLVCDTMKRQIISRAFYGWLAYCRHLSTVRTHLSGLVNQCIVDEEKSDKGLTQDVWQSLDENGVIRDKEQVFRLTYYGGVSHEIRKQVWPYLLGHYNFGSECQERDELDCNTRQNYETTMSEWLAVEAIVRQRDKESMAASLAKLSSESTSGEAPPTPGPAQELRNDVFVSLGSDDDEPSIDDEEQVQTNNLQADVAENCGGCRVLSLCSEGRPPNSPENHSPSDIENSTNKNPLTGIGALDVFVEGSKQTVSSTANLGIPLRIQQSESPDEGMGDEEEIEDENGEIERTLKPSSLSSSKSTALNSGESKSQNGSDTVLQNSGRDIDIGKVGGRDNLAVNDESSSPVSHSNCVSPASSHGKICSTELLEKFGLNVHRIDKDVQRCDRNYWYFTNDNLDKLRNIMCTYVWEHLNIGYMQGMCDLVAPLLVIFDEESITYSCFCLLMERMAANFPNNGGAMDSHFANMRSLIQILDSEMFELMHQNGDYSHFYFCYRWFLLDFKRELLYEDVFIVWETIWSAKHVASSHFMLFIALALVESYRDIILSNSMDFTDIIKFFNEMAEQHNAKSILTLARDLVLQLQQLIENK